MQNILYQICIFLLCQTRIVISLSVCFFSRIHLFLNPIYLYMTSHFNFSVKVQRITIVWRLIFIMFLNYFKYWHYILHSYHDCLPPKDDSGHRWFKLAQYSLCTNWPGKKCLDSCISNSGTEQNCKKASILFIYLFLHELGENKCFIDHFLLSDKTFWLCHRILIEK